MSSNESPRTLTEMLRHFDDAQLAALLQQRPDLASPPPRSLGELAARATTRHSVSSAVDSLNAFELQVARRIVALPTSFSMTDVADIGATADRRPSTAELTTAIDRLRRLALVWGGTHDGFRPVRALRAVLSDSSADQPDTGTGISPSPPPTHHGSRQPPALVAKVAAGSAFELVRRLDVLLEHCTSQPVQLRPNGAVPVRELAAVAQLLDVPAGTARWYIELAEAADLLGVCRSPGADRLAPTSAFASWQRLPLADQWRGVAARWRDDPQAEAPPWLKRLCLTAFGDPADGEVIPGSAVRQWVSWHRPRDAAVVRRLTDRVLEQATELGLLGLGALATHAVDLDGGNGLAALLPARTDEVLLQADLTAVAPGPLTAAAAQELGAMADIESRGGATVYRFTAATVSRAVAQGWAADKMVDALAERSRTPMPQPLEYLIRDAARTVSIDGSTAQPAGPPAGQTVEQPDGRLHQPPTGGYGVPRSLALEEPYPTRLDLSAADAVVAALRAAEDAPDSSATSGRASVEPALSPLAALREAAESKEPVWLSATDADGGRVERLVRVEEVDGGALISVDARSGEPYRLPVRRIIAAHILRYSGHLE